jgi:hypothetical protein
MTGIVPGQSVRGVFRVRTVSNVPAQASRFVRKAPGKLNSFFTVAGIDECSNSEVDVGPVGLCNTATENFNQTKTWKYASTTSRDREVEVKIPVPASM